MSLRQKVTSVHLVSYTRSWGFILPYLAVLSLINIYGGVSLSPLDTTYYRFYYFWHSHGASTGLLTSIMAVNTLMAVYLWIEFRSYRRGPHGHRVAPYVYFACCALSLMLFQFFYLRLSAIEPGYTVVPYDLRTPVAIPWTPDEQRFSRVSG